MVKKIRLVEKCFAWLVGIAGISMIIITAFNVFTSPILKYNTCETITINLIPIFVTGMLLGMGIVIVPLCCLGSRK